MTKMPLERTPKSFRNSGVMPISRSQWTPTSKGLTDEKRKAQGKVVKMLLPGIRRAGDLVNERFWTRGVDDGILQVL